MKAGGDTVSVWWLDLSVIDPARIPADRLLTAEELRRRDRFHRQADRDRFQLGRCLARLAIADRTGCRPEDVGILIGSMGRPSPTNEGTSLSISHSGDIVAVAVGPWPEIGIDVEKHEAGLPEELAATVCSDAECGTLRTCSPPDRLRLFFALWTLKEAYMKATGVGLGLDPTACAFDPANPVRPMSLPDPDGSGSVNPTLWSFRLWQPLSVYSMALAMRPAAGRPCHVAGPADARDLIRRHFG